MENILEFKPRGLKIQPDEKEYLVDNGVSWCNKCKSVKYINDFGKDKTNAYGFEPVCKECRKNAATKRRLENPERVKEIRRRSRNQHAEYSRAKKKEWDENNRDHINEYKRSKYANDLEYKTQILCRSLVRRLFKTTGVKKCEKTEVVLGYSHKDLKDHIESQFKDGMTWNNYGEWHIDHIVPISSAKTLAEGIELSQLSNLQPLWAEENLSKGSKLLDLDN